MKEFQNWRAALIRVAFVLVVMLLPSQALDAFVARVPECLIADG